MTHPFASRVMATLCVLAAAACGDGTSRSRDAFAAATPPRYGIGHAVRRTAIDALDTDVDASGHGLPAGHGDARHGAALFAAKCAGCHGARGQGMPPAYPALIGRDPRTGFPFATDYSMTRTIGNYWPYATTVYDYIARAMPFTAPGSLTSDEIYSLTAYLLAANDILPPNATLDRTSLAAVRMPARDRFVPDDRHGGKEIR